MKIRILGGGVYGCHIALSLLAEGHEIHLHEIADHLFAGASGGCPARLHIGPHYPRSGLTQAACQEHQAEFMAHYGHLTHGVPVNIYAIAAQDSLVDFRSYCDTLRGRVEYINVMPHEHGLKNVEGALLTGERHVLMDNAREWFTEQLGDSVKFGVAPGAVDDPRWDITVDATFCANDAENIDRFEPCVMAVLEGPTDKAVTVMDGMLPSIYPLNEKQGLSSLTSAKFTPISKTCKTWIEAKAILDSQQGFQLAARAESMRQQMAIYWPASLELYKVADYKLTIRAMPRSAADSRLVDVVKIGDRALRVRAGKIDAVFHAERVIKEHLAAMQGSKIRKVA